MSGLSLRGHIEGLAPEDAAALELALVRALERSPWFDRHASSRGAAEVEGSITATRTDAPITLTRPWTEREPYMVTEPRRKRIESMSTVYGGGMVGSRNRRLAPTQFTFPEVRYVTVQERVTKYRETPHVHEYRGTKHHGEYHAQVVLRVDLGPGVCPIEARVIADEARDALSHDEVFAPADLTPHHADVPSAEAWRAAKQAALVQAFADELAARARNPTCRSSG